MNTSTSSRSMELLEVGLGSTFQPCRDVEDDDNNLQNTLFSSLYPDGHVARLSLRSMHPLMASVVMDELFSGIRWKEVTYFPVGSLRSIEKLEMYLIDEVTCKAIASRFHECCEALISEFDLLVTPCDIVTQQDLRVMVIPDRVLGINDWKGWVRQSVFSKSRLPAGGPNYHYPFVMSFSETQARGELKIMDDAIADRHKADIIIPRNCLKPNPGAGFGPFSSGGRFAGPVVLGIKESSQEEQDANRERNLLHGHVCKPGCNTFSSHTMRHALQRACRIEAIAENGSSEE